MRCLLEIIEYSASLTELASNTLPHRNVVKKTLSLLACAVLAALPSANARTLWQIGLSDTNDAEFALAPDSFSRFKEEGLFIVGQSDPRHDWPYVQPGPADTWAGARQHTFTIFFGLRTVPQEGKCTLQLDALDVHPRTPPTIQIEINGQSFERTLLPGKTDDSCGS
jgi:hypothetical protein